MATILDYLNLHFSGPTDLLTSFLLPFMLIFVIFWGMLNWVKIFGTGADSRKINIVISIVITLFAVLTNPLNLVGMLAAFTGQFVYFTFFAVFIIGVILWAVGRTKDVYHETGSGSQHFRNIKGIDKQLEKLYKKRYEAEQRGNQDMMMSLQKDITRLEEQKETLYKLGMRKR